VADVARHFARRHLAATVRPDVRGRLDWHRNRGDRTVIVSASPELYVAEAGRLLGVDEVIATRLEVGPDGRLTGRYEGANCRGEEKIRRLREWLGAEWLGAEGMGAGGPAGRLWAYGNSRGDLRMLAAADVGVNVGRLGRFGRLRDYPDLTGSVSGGPPSDGSPSAPPG
jgi:phosphatidylglycerophosphatase C